MNRPLRPLLLFGLTCLIGSALAPAPLAIAQPAAPSNIACLPFAEGPISGINGDAVSDPVASADRTFITWMDRADGESGYRVERQTGNGPWQTLDSLAPGTTNYTDLGLDPGDDVRYRVVTLDGSVTSIGNPSCRRPRFVERPLAGEQAAFRVFYRPFAAAASTDCPDFVDDSGTPRSMCSTQATAEGIADTLETARRVLMEYGFEDAITNKPLPVDLAPCRAAHGVGCSLGGHINLRPDNVNTPFNPTTFTGDASIWVPLHETFHKVQGDIADPNDRWVIEGQARSIEDKVCLDPWPQSGSGSCTITTDHDPDTSYTRAIENYLLNPNRPLPDISYHAALFWTFITEHYGTITAEPQRGIDVLTTFWEEAAAEPSPDALAVVDRTLEELGYSERFEDVFKDFVVANYAKDIVGVPASLSYIDDDTIAGSGTYAQLTPALNQDLDADTQFILPDEQGLNFISAWGAQYYRFVPDPAVETIALTARTLDGTRVYYHLLAVRNGNLVASPSATDNAFSATIPNDGLDEVVLVVGGLAKSANLQLTVNAADPQLRITAPRASQEAQAGDPAQPEKILIKLEAVAPTGDPLQGLDLDGFTVTIGGVPVPPAQIISRAYIQGEYWLLVRAPAQPGPGTYHLQVSHTAQLSDTAEDAVTYASAVETDNVLVIDRSFSMAGEKIVAAKDAARLYVDSWENGDRIGVVSYATTARTDLSLRNWTSTSRNDAHDLIDGLNANGNTAIGAALTEGLEQLDANGRAANAVGWAMILLSDGAETVAGPPLIADFLTSYEQRAADPSAKLPAVHVVALGADADQNVLQEIAAETGGSYHFAGEPTGGAALAADPALVIHNELAEIYRVIGETVAQEQQIYSARDTMTGNQVRTHSIVVDGSASEAVFVVNWTYPDLVYPFTFELRRPDGALVPVTLSDSRHRVWRVPIPAPGTWQLRVAPSIPGLAAAPAQAEPLADLLVEASLKSDLTLNGFLGLAVAERQVGRSMPIYVGLSDTQPIADATVRAQIVDPAGAVHLRTLYDDGEHGDGAAGDGFYGGRYGATALPGSYQVRIEASGTSPLSGAFTRRLRAAFALRAAADRDGDGIPDPVEEEQGTNPAQPDGTADLDGDGLNNREEHRVGTHPRNSDSDGGGESDHAEVNRGADPLDPADDLVSTPRLRVWPGTGRVAVGFSRAPEHRRMQIFRAPDAGGPFAPVAELALASLDTQLWVDEPVANDQQYCYRIVAVDRNGYTSGASEVRCATPADDPVAPAVAMVINADAPQTSSPAVTLTIEATDSVDSEGDAERAHDVSAGTVASGVREMRIANRSDFADARWEPYTRQVSWQLPDQMGRSQVFVQVRDGAGNISETALDTIVLRPLALYLPLVTR
jgi:uncharacterized protein YegL